MEYFWEGFDKQAARISNTIGKFSKGGRTTPIPGLRNHPPSSSILPGHGAVAVSRKARIVPISQSSRGLPEVPK